MAVPSVPEPTALTKAAALPAWLTGTALTLDTTRGPPLPFAEPAPSIAATPPKQSARTLPKELTGTAPALEDPGGPALPFVASAPRPVTEAPKRSSSSVLEELSGTTPLLDAPRGPALPFAENARAPKASTMSVRPPVPAISPPSLTLEQHASLCVELAIDPSRSAETLARYHQTLASKAQLDNDYRERFARDPALRAAWNRAYQAYGAWLAARRSSPR